MTSQEQCRRCNKPIKGQYILGFADNQAYHLECALDPWMIEFGKKRGLLQ